MRSRFAPSPTGDLHVGGAWTALAAWALARAASGTTILRIEDIDTPRIVRGSAARIEEDLAWLGLDWDEGPASSAPAAPFGPYVQSERLALYEQALGKLEAAGLTYLCDCSRAEIARAASAPHPGEEVVYPGTCRDLPADRKMKRPPAVRLRVTEGTTVAFRDAIRGPVEQRVDVEVGDFVLRRGDGVFSYQLVVAYDDAAMEVTHVVRADDLLASTARQLLLMRLLGFAGDAVPTYVHVPLVVAPDGERLAKRAAGATIRALRERGRSAEEIAGVLGVGLGLLCGAPRSMRLRDIAAELSPPEHWRREPFRLPPSWV